MNKLLCCVVVLHASFAPIVRADKWVDPEPRIFASQNGRYALKSLEPKLLGKSKGMLITLANDGTEKVLWQTTFPNTPHQIFIADSGRYVVTVDTWGVLGGDRSLVIYDSRGKSLKSFRLEDLLQRDEIKSRVKHTVSSRWWAEDAILQISDDVLNIRLSWGKRLRIRLSDGIMERGVEP